MPLNIVEIANTVRSENENLPEYTIQRKVRDAIDDARRRHECSSIVNKPSGVDTETYTVI
jgi:hypothetical protein